MKKTLLAIMIGSSFLCACNGGSTSQEVLLESQTDSVSYALGCLNAQGLQDNLPEELNTELVLAGMKEYLANDSNPETLIPVEQCKTIVDNYSRQKSEEEAAALATENKIAGEAFLKENSTKEGVVTLPSGLQYRVITEGTGAKPGVDDKVSCHYTGRFIGGKIFDSSVQRGQPAEFGVTGVIRGWIEALQLMPVGSKWELFIPSDLAYGEGGRPNIPGNSTLIFELEILEIVK